MKFLLVIRRMVAAAASLRLAVGLLALDAGLLAWATWIESRNGAPAAHFAVYDSVWFLAINAVLAANVLCAVLIRFPWKRRHTGFITTHAGILVLLGGCLLSCLGGIEAHLPVFEGRAVHEAYTDSWHFELSPSPLDAPSLSDEAGEKATDSPDSLLKKGTGSEPPGANVSESGSRETPAPLVQPVPLVQPTPEPICVPFVAGPFNWADYAERSWFPWRIAHRSQGRIYDRAGVVLEVLDYQKNVEDADEPQPQGKVRLTVDGRTEEFDLLGSSGNRREGRQHVVKSESRGMAIALCPDELDLGFQVYLHRFLRKLDPGAETASHYSSLVTFLDCGDPP